MTPLTNDLMKVIGVLWSERQISYDRLCRDYGIDPATLDEIRLELIDIKRIAEDVGGKGLSWVGDPEASVPVPVSPLAASAPQHAPSMVEQTGIQAYTPTLEGGVERRQLTLMFCDLVGSTEIATRIDPEDLREVLKKFRSHCEDAIAQYGGQTVSYSGDGILANFGFPRVREDDAVRAVQTGLLIVETISSLNQGLGIDGVELAVRISIATGPVVIEGRTEDAASGNSDIVGETPNLAARLQGVACANEVVVNEVTKRLVADRIKLVEMGVHRMKGFAAPVPVWRAVGEQDFLATPDDFTIAPDQPLIGRTVELHLLQRAWDASCAHGGQIAFIRGEAGIGKSRLLHALRQQTGSAVKWITFRSAAHHQSTSLYPALTHLKRLLSTSLQGTDETPLAALERLISEVKQLNPLEAVPLLSELLAFKTDASRYPPLDMTADQRREAVLDILIEWLMWEADRAPMVVAWEDLHWSDPTTFRMMKMLIEQIPTVPILLVATYRSDFDLPFAQRSYGTSISINRLEPAEVKQIVSQIAGGKTLPAEVMAHIIDKSDGVPLFVEELTKTILESDALTKSNGGYEMNASMVDTAIPSTLQDSLMARLDRIPNVKQIAQIGAVLGRDFGYDILSAVSGIQDEDLENGLGHLIDNEILYQRGRPPRSRYYFKHALIQDAAYQCLLRRERRNIHNHIATILETQFPDVVAETPELMAHHLTEAGEMARAAAYWLHAGEKASEQSAYLEAIEHFGRAQTALEGLDETPERIALEVKANFLQGAAYFMTKGHGAQEVEEAYSRAYALSARVEDTPNMFPVLSGLWRCFVMRPKLETACELGSQLLRVAEREQSVEQLVVAQCAAAINAFYVGDFQDCVDFATKSRASYRISQRDSIMYRAGTDPAVLDGAYSSWALWLLGRPKQAISRVLEMQDHARITDHPFSMAAADCYAAVMFQMLRDASRTRSYSESGIALSEKRGFKFWWAYGTVQRGWALAHEGRLTEGIAAMREGIAQQRSGGAAIKVPFWMGLLAEALLAQRQMDEALSLSDEALDLMAETGDCFAQAELIRIKGEIVFARGDPGGDAEALFKQAITVARDQKAVSWELRAALSLARHWRHIGHGSRAQGLLAQIIQSVASGGITGDVRAAQIMLAQETA